MTTLSDILDANPELANVYGWLLTLDPNGACCAANVIEDTHNSGGCLSELTAELRDTCESIATQD